MDDDMRAAAERLHRHFSGPAISWGRHQRDAKAIADAVVSGHLVPAELPVIGGERTAARFAAELYALMGRFGVIVDHDHDSESLSDGWHFKGPGWELSMGATYYRKVPQTEGRPAPEGRP